MMINDTDLNLSTTCACVFLTLILISHLLSDKYAPQYFFSCACTCTYGKAWISVSSWKKTIRTFMIIGDSKILISAVCAKVFDIYLISIYIRSPIPRILTI